MDAAERVEATEHLAHYRALQTVMGRRDELFTIVLAAKSEDEAAAEVANHFGISVLQAGAVLSLTVARWTVEGRQKFADEISHLERILALER
jgi:DNA gyrase/topoisomerase IV subunit A